MLAGFATVRPSDGYLDQIAVDPRFWGQGVAEALVADARMIAPGGLHLLVNAMNARAMGFYEKMGFSRCEAGMNALSGLPTWRYEWRPGTVRPGTVRRGRVLPGPGG